MLLAPIALAVLAAGGSVTSSGAHRACATVTLSISLESALVAKVTAVQWGDAAIVRVEGLRVGTEDAFQQRRSYLVEGDGVAMVALIDTITVEGSEGLAVRELLPGERLARR